MASTTPKQIRESIESTIESISVPTDVKAGDSRSFRVASGRYDWETRPDSDCDRRFTVRVEPGNVRSFGAYSEQEIDALLVVELGHLPLSSMTDTMDRIVADCREIRAALESQANYPSAVWLIASRSPTMTVQQYPDRKHSMTELTFDVRYLESKT